MSTGILYGYSERGVVNALFEDLANAGDATLLEKVLKDMVSYSKNPATKLPHFDSFSIYVEPSLSQFGSPDVVLFLCDEGRDVAVYFIEAKLESFMESTRKAKGDEPDSIDYTHNSSSILHELFLKMRSWDYLKARKGLPEGVNVYQGDSIYRSFGRDPMVLDLAERIFEAPVAFFVALATDAIGSDGSPKQSQKVCDEVTNICQRNGMGKSKDKLIPPLASNPSNSIAHLFLMQWQRIWALTAKEPRLSRTRRELERNETKFSIPWTDPVKPQALLAEATKGILTELGPKESQGAELTWSKRKGPKGTLNLGRLALATVQERAGFERRFLDLYLPKGRDRSDATPFAPAKLVVELISLHGDWEFDGAGKALLKDIVKKHLAQLTNHP
jgi:hypothetical protein